MTKYANPLLMSLARRLPPLVVLHHRGRRSGREFNSPVQAYRTQNGTFLVGLAYHRDANWALNMLAAGGGSMTRAGARYALSRPRRRSAEARADLPRPVAALMRSLKIDDFIEFDATPAS
ncbi:hypothetical protein [Actinoplanes sp. NPDC051851]|uniref:hypothetical protein n=1 Tax=Actinoplanes sp. NPDC051851 TaxID=3154753 RepID=UPI00341A3B50